MKFSLLSTIGLFGLAIAAPAANPEASVALETRQSKEAQAYTIVDNLYTEIKQYTGAINTTAASIHADSTAAQNATALATFRTNINQITTAVNAAKAKTDALDAPALMKRQTDAALAALLEGLLTEVSGALNGIVATLGLTGLLSALNPLVASLSGLLLSLENLVDNLLALVKQLVDGLLTGLSVGLSGLVL